MWSAALVSAACSVFPDQAVLPGSGGASGAGGASGGFDGFGGAGGGAALSGGNAGTSARGGVPNTNAGGSAGNSFAGTAGAAGMNGGAGGAAGGDSLGGGGASGGADVGTGGSLGGSGGGSLGGQGGNGNGGCPNATSLTLVATEDSYMSEVLADQKTNFGGDMRLRVSGVADARAHAVLTFDFSQVPTGASVRSAVLRFALGAAVAEARTLSVWALARDFRENRVTWERAVQNSKWVTPGGDTAVAWTSELVVGPSVQAGALVNFDVSADVGLAAQGSWPGYGWLIASEPSADAVDFVSRESAFAAEQPRLEITLCP